MRRWIARLHAGVNIEWHRREGPQRRRHRRTKRHIQVTETERLYLQRIAGHAWIVEIARRRNSLALRIDEHREKYRIQIRQSIAIVVGEITVINRLRTRRRGDP